MKIIYYILILLFSMSFFFACHNLAEETCRPQLLEYPEDVRYRLDVNINEQYANKLSLDEIRDSEREKNMPGIMSRLSLNEEQIEELMPIFDQIRKEAMQIHNEMQSSHRRRKRNSGNMMKRHHRKKKPFDNETRELIRPILNEEQNLKLDNMLEELKNRRHLRERHRKRNSHKDLMDRFDCQEQSTPENRHQTEESSSQHH